MARLKREYDAQEVTVEIRRDGEEREARVLDEVQEANRRIDAFSTPVDRRVTVDQIIRRSIFA